MANYCRIEKGIVVELIPSDKYAEDGAMYDAGTNQWVSVAAGDEIPIERRFTAEFVGTLVDVTGVTPAPECWWSYDGTNFLPPSAHQPTAEEIIAGNTSNRDALLRKAALAMAPLQDAIDLEVATEGETAQLKKWKQYRVDVNRIDLTRRDPEWPIQT